MTEYASDLAATIVFPKDSLQNTLGDCLQQHKLSQLRIAETEKYAHVTFFFNGGSDQPFAHEQRLLIPSPKVATYDNNPEMSSFVITEELIKIIQQKTYDVIICNFANADMIGHTGNLTAAIAAIEAIDLCLGKIITAITAVDGEMMITADHGNAEQMFDEHSAQPHTAHTTSLVPLIYVGKRKLKFNSSVATLANVAPSMLALLGLTIPPEMTGKSLINFN